MINLRTRLLAWREEEAMKLGLPLYRILSTASINDIVRAQPHTKEELCAIKGIKDAKFAQFGHAILGMVAEHSIRDLAGDEASPAQEAVMTDPQRTVFTVSSYLDQINHALWRISAPVQGEVISAKYQGSAVYFSLRDAKDSSILSVFMWEKDARESGIELKEGLEVIVTGRSEIYKPNGRFNFRADAVELVGEGAWKKAYDDLKSKLEVEGLFALPRKRTLKELPKRIGVITSRQGAVIHDFMNNLGRFGYHVLFVDSRVEGVLATRDILSSLAILAKEKLDALVLIRGGGSLESLQAFNNEAVVRAVSEFPAVTITAIGHDKDVPLVQLVSDYASSTPTATTTLLNASWDTLAGELRLAERKLLLALHTMRSEARGSLRAHASRLASHLERMREPFIFQVRKYRNLVDRLGINHERVRESLQGMRQLFAQSELGALRRAKEELVYMQRTISQESPLRLLRLGYSIAFAHGKLIRDIHTMATGDHFALRMEGGTLDATVEKLTHRKT